MTEKRILVAILILFTVLGATYAIVTPVFEASDELWHYPMVRHLAHGNDLPVQVFDPAQAGPWKQEASQPPLYYYVAAALTFWIDTSDMDQVRHLNPHVDNGIITGDGNINLVVHNAQASPWRGTLLAVRIVRLISVLMGAATVYLTYLIAREIAPERPHISLGAAAVNAFTPMFLFISGAVNNDNLAIPLTSLALLLMIRAVQHRRHNYSRIRSVGKWGLIGIVIGLAALTKEGTLGLLPLAWGTAFIAVWNEAPEAPARQNAVTGEPPWTSRLSLTFVRSLALFAVVLLPVLLIAGWWYYRNLILYGDWLGWNAFLAVLGQRPQPASLAQLWGERWGFLASYWGLFGGVNVPMWQWIYRVLNGLLILATVGFCAYLLLTVRAWQPNDAAYTSGPQKVIFGLLAFVKDHVGLIVCLLFSAAVVLGIVRWSTVTWSSQGRLAFTAISPLSILLTLGLVGWMPRRPATMGITSLVVFMFLVSAAAPFLWIQPAYQPSQAAPRADLEPVDVSFEGKMRLSGFQVEAAGDEKLHPGDRLRVTLAWEVLETMDTDWSVFVHLNDPVLGTPLAQRDMYPGQGLLSTRWLDPGRSVVDQYQLQIPATAIAPSSLQLVVGLYNYKTDRRLQNENGGDALTLETLALEPRPGETPNATSINFGHALDLVGFNVAGRRLGPGQELELTSYWRARRPLDTDYTLFAQLLDAEDTTRWAASDLPQNTSSWPAGEVREITMTLDVRPDTPPGVYPIVLGAYTRDDDGNFNRLQIVREGRLTMDDSLNLTVVRVE